MLFDTGSDVFESEKERNLYYKVFAGYLFNEHIAGFEARLERFCHLLDESPDRGQAASDEPVVLSPATTHVSFDNHAYRFEGCGIDRGELADILVHDRSTRTIVTIEAKVHSDWSYRKDILENDARLRRIEERIPGVRLVPCLLVSRSKWEAVQKQRNHGGSQYRLFVESPDNRFRILLWEDVAEVCGEDSVRRFVAAALSDRSGEVAYTFGDDWFRRRGA
jgi:hypothetical protein